LGIATTNNKRAFFQQETIFRDIKHDCTAEDINCETDKTEQL
jgi:hypothetical protein